VFDQFAAHGESSLRTGPKNDRQPENILTHRTVGSAAFRGAGRNCFSIDAIAKHLRVSANQSTAGGIELGEKELALLRNQAVMASRQAT
jgi:hypothetical protein